MRIILNKGMAKEIKVINPEKQLRMWDYYINDVKVGCVIKQKKINSHLHKIPHEYFYLSYIMLPHTMGLLEYMGKNSVYVDSKKQAIKNIRKRLIFQYKEYSKMFNLTNP